MDCKEIQKHPIIIGTGKKARVQVKNPKSKQHMKNKEDDMKKRLGYHLISVTVIVFVLAGITFSEERATKEEVVTKVGEAAKMIRDIGRDETIKKNDRAKKSLYLEKCPCLSHGRGKWCFTGS